MPIGIFAACSGGTLKIRGSIFELDGKEVVENELVGPMENAEQIGVELARKLKKDGGDALLENIRNRMEREGSKIWQDSGS